MNKKKKNNNYHSFLSKEKEDIAAAARERKKEAFKKNKKYLLPLLVNTVLFYAVYSVLSNTPACTIVLWVYAALTVGFSITYIIYNRGFTRKNLTPDMLSDTMTAEEKQRFIDDGNERLDKSKWMITIIFPLVMTFMIDIMILFMIEPLIDSLGIRF